MSALVLCSLTVIVTLLWSGIAKALDRSSTAQAIINLKLDHFLPLRLSSMVAPWLEIILALGLLFVPGMLGSIFAVLTLLLFVFYWGIIMRAVIAGNQATCNCFGGQSNAPVSFYTLFRNTGLVLAAAGAFASALLNRTSTAGVLFTMDAESWLWTFGAALIAFILWAIYRAEQVPASTATATAPTSFSTKNQEEGGVLTSEDTDEAEEELAEGYTYDGEEDDDAYERLPIPNIFVETPESHRYSLRKLSKIQARVLFYVSPTCMPCRDILQEIPAWDKKLPMLGLGVVVSSQSQVEKLNLPEEIEIYVDTDRGFAKNFGGSTPIAVALGADGLFAGGPVAGSGDVKEFMDDIMYEMGVSEED